MTTPAEPAAPSTATDQTTGETTATERPAPCCGTRAAADASGACCDPAAKKDAVAAGASCCG
ncbi:MAG: hypothetical protein HY830_19140 [Actinobacteria bacterium]|nr:hypothetical protein [Actinomycetota bacterium]